MGDRAGSWPNDEFDRCKSGENNSKWKFKYGDKFLNNSKFTIPNFFLKNFKSNFTKKIKKKIQKKKLTSGAPKSSAPLVTGIVVAHY